jgi:hypothetical protein
MRRIGGTCTAAQKRLRCKNVATEKYDQNGGGIRRRRRVPVGMASVASQGPIARIAASGSAKFRLLTCVRRHHHAISAEYARFPPPRERQAPITQLATEHRDPRQDRRQPGGETPQKGCDDIVTLGRAVCTHRMRLGGSRQRLGNGGFRQRVYDVGNCLTGGRANVAAHIYQQVPQGGRPRNLPGGMRGPFLPSISKVATVDCWISRSGYTLSSCY